MLYLLQQFWIWCLIALVLGIVVSWITYGKGEEKRSFWFNLLILIGIIGLLVAVFYGFKGRLGLGLEIALLLLASYLVGCCLPMICGLWRADTGSTMEEYEPAKMMDKPMMDKPVMAAEAPKMMPKVENEDKHEGARPIGLMERRTGNVDDLKLIRGIGKQNEARLHALGIWHFDQIAAWTHDNILWVGSYLAFPGRIDREEWVSQAKVLAKGGETDFAQRVKRGEVETSKDDGSKGQDNVAKMDMGGAHPGQAPKK